MLAALFLLYRYITIPLFYLFRIKKGISHREASVLIGKHFPQVGDKLLNLIDLAQDDNQSELLLASIEQRSKQMDPIPFIGAVNLREGYVYAKYLLIPVIIILLLLISGNLASFFGSYERVVNYDLAYEPPAPFSFELLAGDARVLETESYTIQVTTKGSIQPEDIYIVIDGKERLLQKNKGVFEYVFQPPLKDVQFYFKANGVVSRNFELKALKAPAIQGFNMVLEYPSYINKPNESLKGTGNASFPEGTKVTWKIEGENTETVRYIAPDTSLVFERNGKEFKLSKKVFSKLNYQLATSNDNVENYETLDYEFTVIKDGYPTIRVAEVLDSLNPNVAYYSGEASDDYELASISLVCYPDRDEENIQRIQLTRPNKNFEKFYYTFPSGLELEEGVAYSFYFEALDNDGIRGGKLSKSEVFSLALLNDNELKDKQLDDQESIINNIDNSLDNFKKQKEELKEINKNQKEKKTLNFNDQNKVKDFLKNQQQQEQLMEKFSKQLKENLEKSDADDPLNKLLKERLERQEIEARKNEKLLEELNKVADKINKEELSKRLEEVAKKQQTSERNLEQLLELTKRYYVTEKTAQLAKDLEKLAEEQNELSESEEKTGEIEKEQKELNEKFQELIKELEELKKDNEALKKPLKIGEDKETENEIKKDQEEALEELKKQQQSDDGQGDKGAASKKQKSAAQKMQQMSQQLQQSSSGGGGGPSVTEDAEMLRQILDNLITFSFKQEKLLNKLSTNEVDVTQFSNNVKKQQELRELFEHVDDSLFSLSLRRAELSEFVNEQITEVYYNVDKALENMAENRIYQGVSYQKYVLNASNSLADFLANILDNMQQSMQSGQGSGGGEGFQLPDIIQGQGQIGEQLGQMGKSGKGKEQGSEGGKQQGNEGKGQDGQDGEGNNEGEGEQQKGKGKGKNGEGEQNGENGGTGKDGKGEGSNGGEGELSEEELKEIYEIYKEQQRIRQELEKQLENFIQKSDKELAKKLVRQMEDFENDLLENGVTQQNLNKANNIQYRLLKLEKAALKQGEKEERESDTNRKNFDNPITTKPSLLENYKNEIEILNRQALPLQNIYRNKVKHYFNKND